MNETEQLKTLLLKSLASEKKALKQLKLKEVEISELKNKVNLYERRWERLMSLLPVKVLVRIKNTIKGLK